MKFGLFSRPVSALGFLLAAGFSVASAAPVHLKISANSLIIDSFNKWTAATPVDQITKFDSPYANRGAVELVLELQALKLGGLDFDYSLVTAPNYERAKLEVLQGRADLTAETLWDSEIAAAGPVWFKTDPIIRDGDFVKGIYTLPTNDKLLHATSLEDMHDFVGITVATWDLDVKALDGMHLKGVEKAPKSENIFLMIAKHRADFTLLEFSSAPDMSNESNGVKLVPVPNVKIALKGSRSWVVSKNNPDAAAIYAALTKGVKAMRAEGRIERAYQESGFILARVSDWKRLL